MIWIIGEYAERIDNADELLDTFLETFEEEDPAVQLQLLTATVKCFLKNPEDTQEMVQRVLDLATEESDNPDLRDRGFIYWRLLSTDPEAAKLVVLGDKPVIEDDTFRLEPNLLGVLVGQIATLSSIYHKPPEAFVVRAGGEGKGLIRGGSGSNSNEDEVIEEGDEDDEYSEEEGEGEPVDLLDMGGLGLEEKVTSAVPSAKLHKVCSAEKASGIEVSAGFRKAVASDQNGGGENGSNVVVCMEIEWNNIECPEPVSSLAIQLNKNAFGLSPSSQQIMMKPPIAAGSKGHSSVGLIVTPTMLSAPPPAVNGNGGQPASPQVQVAIKNMATASVFYFAANFPFQALFSPDGALERTAFIDAWKSIDDQKELYGTVSDLTQGSVNVDSVQETFRTRNIFFIARRPVPNAEGQEVVYFSMKTMGTGMTFLAELTFKAGVNACKICVKTESSSYGILAKIALENILRGEDS